MTVRAVMALTAALLTLTACSGGGPEPAASSAPGGLETLQAAPPLAPTGLGERPLWTAEGVARVRLGGDLAMLEQVGSDGKSVLIAADAQTGAERWRLPASDTVPGSRAKRDGLVPPTPTADGEAVVVGLRSPSSGSTPSVAGVAALSAGKGETIWAFEPGDGTLITSAHPGPAYTVLALGGAQPSVVVLDNRDGREAWRAEGLALASVTENIVIAGGPALSGYDITGGARLWRHPSSGVVTWADAKVVAVSSSEGREPVTDLLDARTGALLRRLDASIHLVTCASDTTGLACDAEDASDGHRLLTMTYPQGGIAVSGTTLPGRVIALSTWRGRTAVGESTLDAAGNPVTPPLPGQVLATGGAFAAFGPPIGLKGVSVAVYRVEG